MSFTINELMNYPAYTGGPSVSQVLKDMHLQRTKVDTVIAKVDALPAKVPVTVQGASEQFILDGLGKVVANTNTAANTLSVGIGQSEARVIARINATHGA